MQLLVFGGDERMEGAVAAAVRAGWTVRHIRREEEVPKCGAADAVMLPWPRSFDGGQLFGGSISRQRVLEILPKDCPVLHGADAGQGEALWFDPAQDEAFVQMNAQLTAEGAIARAMERPGRALLDETCLITGFGRIGQALALRLAALRAFVIVCARSEEQMRLAHSMGAHPMPLERLAPACAQADVLFNTVPARILGSDVLSAVKKDALLIDLAGAPHGTDEAFCARMGVQYVRLGGLPAKYAGMAAGAALFGALARRMGRKEKEGGADG